MPLRHLVVTPLPNGRNGNTLALSVHLSPRLREDGVLSDYPDFADWGQFVLTAPALQFEVLINGAVRPGVTVAAVSPPVEPAVWRAVFGRPPAAIPVRAFAFEDRSNVDLTSIDSRELSDRTMGLARAMSALGAAGTTKADVLAATGSLLNGTLSSAQRFFGPIGNGQDPPPPSVEFHDQLGPLGAHPFLMRVLGLVFDLEVTVPAGGGVITEIAVRTNWPTKTGLAAHDQVPMRVSVDADFKAVVDDTEFRESDWLRLGGAKYSLSQLDLANATHQLTHLVDDLANAPDATSEIEVPALLESGLSLICGDLDDVLRSRLERQREVENGIDDWLRNKPNTPPPLLFAEDITLGYRCDVDDLAASGYRSLHDRQSPTGYEFPRDKSLAVKPPADEGWSSIALFTDGSRVRIPQTTSVRYHQEGGPDVVKTEERDQTSWRVDDHVTTWGGWSLAVPRVGNSTTGSGDVKPTEQNAPAPNSPTQVIVDYAHVNGSLPKLRYGHAYTLRARCVDLGGHGPRLADPPPASAESVEVQFGRLAPLVPPLPLRRQSRPDPGVGDLPDVLVIKSELHQSNRDTPATDRLLFPPRISQGRLERHDLPAGGSDPASYGFIAEHDAVSVADQTIIDPETSELVAGEALVDGQVTPGPTKPAIGYLVDPVAGRAAFIGLPGANGDTALIPYGAWPDIAAVQLELKAGTGAPSLARKQQRISVSLPKGTVASAELSTAPDPNLLDHMALGQDLAGTGRAEALDGLNRSLSPRRPIKFVHAVRLPLLPPSFGTMTATRTDVGQTDVVLAGSLGLHRATTDHVVLRSRWTDPVDDLTADGPVDQVTKKVVTDLAISFAGDSDTAETVDQTRLDLGDTKRRHVELVGESFCRFSRYFTERIDFISDGTSNTLVLDAAGVVPASVVLTRLDGSERFERNVQFAVERASGALTILDTTAIPAGTACRVEFIPLPVSRLSIEAAGAAKKFSFDVPSSAPPDLPDVLAVLPAFARRVAESTDRITVVHDGRVLRLHLARPWFSSGAGELLGVAIDGSGSPASALTRWARDPLTAATGPTTEPTTASFPKATEVANAVDGVFDVAAHDVVYDTDRKIWTADVLVDARFGYRPFVQLHVCRYQPLALDGQHVSAAVQLDPVRLGAARRVIVSNEADDTVSVRLSGADNVNIVSVVLQEADASIADPDLRWHDVSTTVLARTGSKLAATHSGLVTVPKSGNERRLVIDDSEPVTVEVNGALEPGTAVAYREVIPIPADW